jgi:short-subunit dehydrogenase
MEVRMTGKGWAIVTGASGGMGAAFTRALAQRGHPVLAVARSAQGLARVADDAKEHGGFVETLAVDLAINPLSGRLSRSG